MKYAVRLVLGLIMAAAVTTATADDKAKSMTAQGKVTAVTGDSFTIMKGTESMTFTVDQTTKLEGKGLTTKTTEKAAKGEKMTLSDSLGDGDQVNVTYHDVGGKMHASRVKITQRALTTK